MVSGVVLDVRALTEDKDGRVIQAVLARSLEPLQPGYRRDAVRFSPATPAAAEAARANVWKAKATEGSAGQRKALTTVVREVINFLLQPGPLCVVFWHVDADKPWSERTKSENAARFAKDVLENVRLGLENEARRRGDLKPEALLSRIILVLPCAAIESWLYLNHDVLRDHAAKQGLQSEVESLIARCGAHGFDEVEGVKWCTKVEDFANLALAQRFKPEHARTRSPSYRAFLDGLIAHSELNAVMAQATYR